MPSAPTRHGVGRGGTRILWIESIKAFAQAPAVVAAVDDDVDLLPTILAHVGENQIVFAAAIKRHAPRIAQTVGEDFRKALLAVGKGIVVRNAVGRSAIHVEAQHLAEQRVELLAVALGRMAASARDIADIVVGTAIAHAHIQKAIRPKGEASAVVIPVRLVDFQNDAFGGWIGGGEICVSGFELAEAFRVIPFRRRVGPKRRAIDDVEFPVGLELRMQRQPEKPALLHAFVDRDHFRAQIQEGLLGFFPVAVEEMNDTALLREEQAARAVRNGNQRHRCADSFDHQFQTDVRNRRLLQLRRPATDRQER